MSDLSSKQDVEEVLKQIYCEDLEFDFLLFWKDGVKKLSIINGEVKSLIDRE